MAASATYKTRIVNKHDTYENWETHGDVVLLKGEIAVVEVPTETSPPDGVQGTPPIMLLKVGDGETAFSSLPYLTAKAGDVYAWAKSPSKPAYTAAEITGLDEKIQGIAKDTDTHYKLVLDESDKEEGHTVTVKLQSSDKTEGTWTDVAGSSATLDVYDDTEIKAGIASLKTLVGEESVESRISAAKTDLEGKIGAKQDKLTWAGESMDYDGDANKAATDTFVNDAVTKAVSGLKTTVSSEIDADVLAAKTELEGKIDGKQDKLVFAGEAPYDSSTNKAVTEQYLQSQISGLSGAMKWAGKQDALPDGDNEGQYHTGDVITVENIEYAWNGEEWQKLGDEGIYSEKVAGWDTAASQTHTHANSAELAKITDGSVAKWNAAETNAKSAAQTALEAAKGELEASIAEKAAATHKHKFTDLEQDEGTWIAFDCGSATEQVEAGDGA